MSGKGSAPRPYSVDKNTYDDNWEKVFSRKSREDNTGTTKDEYYDVLTTEEALSGTREEQ